MAQVLLFPMFSVSYLHISTFQSMCAVQNTAVCCSSLMFTTTTTAAAAITIFLSSSHHAHKTNRDLQVLHKGSTLLCNVMLWETWLLSCLQVTMSRWRW